MSFSPCSYAAVALEASLASSSREAPSLVFDQSGDHLTHGVVVLTPDYSAEDLYEASQACCPGCEWFLLHPLQRVGTPN